MIALPEPSQVGDWVDQAVALPLLQAHREKLSRLKEDYARSHTKTERALVVALVGATGAGKSTLLNALAGRSLATEGVNRPTSRKATAYAPDDAWVEDLEAAGAQVRRYSAAAIPRAAAHVYVDTPDLNSVERIHRERARGILERADVAMVVMHRGSVAESTQLEFLEPFARRRRLLWVVNFADELGPSSRAELKAQAHRLAEEQFGLSSEGKDAGPVFAVSALQAKRDPSTAFEFSALEGCLRDWAEKGNAQTLRRSNAVAVLGELSAIAYAGVTAFEKQLEDLTHALDDGLAAAADPLKNDFQDRLQAAKLRLRDEVRKQAAASWWGPGAWWLRLSGIGAGGLGAATLIARGSLPVGLAVAAASTVLSKAQELARAKAADNHVVAPPEAEETTAAVALRSALSGARTAAAKEGLAPDKIALPKNTEALVALRELHAGAWRYTEDRAISSVVGGWWRWARFLLIPLVNLPLLALLGDVGYRVVNAYWEGRYLGADYFLNALALGGLLSAVGAGLAAASLAGAVRRVRQLGLQQFTAAYGLYRRTAVDRLTESLQPARKAAHQLAALGGIPSSNGSI